MRSPCVGICSATALGDEICVGCRRTFQEVIDWNQLPKEQKVKILERLNNELHVIASKSS